MKKILAGMMALAMLLTALALPAMAEEQTASAAASVTAKNGHRGGQPGNGAAGQQPGNGQNAPRDQQPGNGQNAPQGQQPGNGQNVPQGLQPGRNGMNGPRGQAPGNAPQTPGTSGQTAPEAQTPGASGQTTPDTQTPDNGEQTTPDTQTPDTGDQTAPDTSTQATPQQPDQTAQNGRPQAPRNGRGRKDQGSLGRLNLKSLVENNIIDQETLEKIEDYLKKNAPAKPEKPAAAQGTGDGAASTDGTTPPALPEAPADGTTPPALPEAPTDGTGTPAMPENGSAQPESDLLAKLVEEGILTQEQADAILAQMNPSVTETETAAATEEKTNG